MNSSVNFHFIEQGDQDKPSLLMLHGFLGTCNDWDDVIAGLSQDFHCLAVDLPGHGQTKTGINDELYGMERCAQELISFLDQRSIKRCHLIGYSMGGRLALYLAINYPEKFDKVMLESSSPGLKTENERKQRREHDLTIADKIRQTSLMEFLNDWYQQPLFESLLNNRERFQELFDRRLNNDQSGLARSLLQMGTGSQPSLWGRLEEIRNDLLLIVGENDNKFRAIGDEIALRISSVKLLVIPDCGHNPHFEKPDRFVEIVRNYLMGSME